MTSQEESFEKKMLHAVRYQRPETSLDPEKLSEDSKENSSNDVSSSMSKTNKLATGIGVAIGAFAAVTTMTLFESAIAYLILTSMLGLSLTFIQVMGAVLLFELFRPRK